MKKHLIKFAELSLIYAVADLYIQDTKKRSILHNLYKKLLNASKASLSKCPGVTDVDKLWVVDVVHDWGDAAGWLNNETYAGEAVSFCLRMIEDSEFRFSKKIITTLKNITWHLEDEKSFPAENSRSGDLACAKWQEILRKIENGERKETVLYPDNHCVSCGAPVNKDGKIVFCDWCQAAHDQRNR